MVVKFKKLVEEAVTPKYSKPGDAGMDLTATGMGWDEKGNVVYHTGLAIEIPQGYVGLLFPRSSNSKKDLFMTNHVGVIDSGYRGEIMFKFRRTVSFRADIYEIGDRIGQLIIIPYPEIQFEEVEELSNTERGSGGYGSTGS